MKSLTNKKATQGQKGFSLPELIIVLLVIAILVVLALPQMIASKRAFGFAGLKRQAATTLNAARQEAISQRELITVYYKDENKKMVTYGGKFGALGDARNQTFDFGNSGVEASDISYGRPAGVTTAALADTTNLTELVNDEVKVTFQPDGSVLDAAANPLNNALFFYHQTYSNEMAFAISVLGAGGRVKIWRYNQATNSYVE